jgi:multiple RNA-binding domain-containing protein 1
LVLPPTKVLALVEYGEPQEARSAFKTLAYKKFHHVPLYLEWAPKEIFSVSASEAAAARNKGQGKGVEKDSTAATAAAAGGELGDAKARKKEKNASSKQAADAAAAAAAEGGEEEDGDAAPVASIYVKNLNFGTTDAALKKHFDKAVSAAGGTIHSAKVRGADYKVWGGRGVSFSA